MYSGQSHLTLTRATAGVPLIEFFRGVTVTVHRPLFKRVALQVTVRRDEVQRNVFFCFPRVADAVYVVPLALVNVTFKERFPPLALTPVGRLGPFAVAVGW
jgi:hypothetical protein